jgi:poly-gamma-glutamate capsule biosynthesis protein CapA/YwtB (metallophosphatase superfamily)
MKLFITGDFCPIGRNDELIHSKDYKLVFGDILNYLDSADLSITNLEAPATESTNPIIKSGPNIKVKPTTLNSLFNAGFNLVTLANNHIQDYGSIGIKDTMSYCKEYNIDFVGAGSNLAEARKPFITIIENKKIGILNFAENEFCAATSNTYGANPVNIINNHNDIVNLKKQVDYIIIIAHGGREHYQLPTPNLRERYRFYAECGADLIIGHHTHCYSGYEIHNNTPIFYSLGNFIFDYKKKYQKGLWTQGFGLEITIINDNIDFKLIPFHQGRESNPRLVLFNEEEKKEFDENIKKLNNIITNDIAFFDKWNDYLKSQKADYKGNLLIQNKFIRAAIKKGLLPKLYFHSKSHKVLLLNLFQCESHREIMIEIIKKDIE